MLKGSDFLQLPFTNKTINRELLDDIMNRWLPQSREVVWGTTVYDDNTISKKTLLKFIDQESLLKWWNELATPPQIHHGRKNYEANLKDLIITYKEWVTLNDYLKETKHEYYTRGEEE